MKKFLVFVMICIVLLGVGFATFRFTTKQEVIMVDTTAIICNKGDVFSVDVEIRNKKDSTTVTIEPIDEASKAIVNVSQTSGENDFKFDALRGGKAQLVVKANVSGFANQVIDVTVGDGSSSDLPIIITSTTQYKKIGNDSEGVYGLDKYYRLMNDLSFEGNYSVIGTAENPFTREFDFNGHKLSDVAVEANDVKTVGLFASTSREAIIKNLILNDFASRGSAKTGTVCIGAVVGINQGKIRDVEIGRVTIEDSSDIAYFGGVAGQNMGEIKRVVVGATAINAATNSTPSANSIAGGIAGLNSTEGANIFACSVLPNIKAGKYVGGIAGQNDSATIENCAIGQLETVYALNGMAAESLVGGVVGYNVYSTNKSSVADCYTLVNLGTLGTRGGIVGKNTNKMDGSKTLENPVFGCYYNTAISGDGINAFGAYEVNYSSTSKYNEYVFNKTSDELTTSKDTYVSYLYKVSETEELSILWQFDSVWAFSAGDVPQLLTRRTDGISRIDTFVAASGSKTDLSGEVSGSSIDPHTNYKITGNTTFTSPIPEYAAIMEGVPDANGHYPTVSFDYSNFIGDWAALFGTLTSSGQVKNLNFDITIGNVTATSVRFYAELVAHNYGVVDNVTMKAESSVSTAVTPDDTLYVGGIVADNFGKVLNSTHLGVVYVSSQMTMASYVGGIVGRNEEDAAITSVTNGTSGTPNAVTVYKPFVGSVGGIVGLSNADVEGAKNYEKVTVNSAKDNTSTYLGGIAGKLDGKTINVEVSANYGDLICRNVGGIVGLLASQPGGANGDMVISECLSKSTIQGVCVGGIVCVGNCGLIENCLSNSHLTGLNGETDSSVLAGLIYKMNVSSAGIIRAKNCISYCSFGEAGAMYYEDANQKVMGSSNQASILRGGYYGEPINSYGCVDLYALNNCYAIDNGDARVKRTDGLAFQSNSQADRNSKNVVVNAKSDHFISISDGNAISAMYTNDIEKVLVKDSGYFVIGFIRTSLETTNLAVSPFASSIWTLEVGKIQLKVFGTL